MKKIVCVLLAALLTLTAFTACGKQAETAGNAGASMETEKAPGELFTRNWDDEPVEYEHFTDLGHYMIELKGISVNDIPDGLAYHAKTGDSYASNACSGTVKKNDLNEVIMSHSMEVEVSQSPAFITRISDGKYDTLLITYTGATTPYLYTPEDLAAMDKNTDYLKLVPVKATDVMNETGLYISLDMRAGDADGGMDCPGTNPGKPRASALSAPALVGLNCATVKEAVEFLNDSYDWYTLAFSYESGASFSWNMAFLIGDATGEYGLVEFGRNGVYFTPYQNFQSNYYIHPLLAERATLNHGHGRAAELLDGLMDVQTEQEIKDNQKNALYSHQMMNPSWEFYSDAEELSDINARRTLSAEEQARIYDEEIVRTGGFEDNIEKIKAYYAGDETGLRNDSWVWMSTIMTGVNCATKHAIIEMWENNTVIEVQWP